MELLHQLARGNKVQLNKKPEDDEKALAVVTRAQERRMAHQWEDGVETSKKNPPEEDTVGMQEDISDTQGWDPIDGQGSGEEIAVDKDCPMVIEFLFDKELFEKSRKLTAHLTRVEKRRHYQQGTSLGGCTTTIQLKKEQEEDPEVRKWMTQEDPTCIKHIEGVLCRTWNSRDSPDTVYE